MSHLGNTLSSDRSGISTGVRLTAICIAGGRSGSFSSSMPQMMMLHSSTSLLTSLCPCKCLTCTELQSLECNAPSAPGALALSDTNEYLQNFAWIALTTAAARIKWIVRMTGIMLSGIRASPCIPLACGHRLRGRSLPMLQASRRNRTSGRSRQQQVVQAAAASFSPDDPYKVVCFPTAHFTPQSRFSCPGGSDTVPSCVCCRS